MDNGNNILKPDIKSGVVLENDAGTLFTIYSIEIIWSGLQESYITKINMTNHENDRDMYLFLDELSRLILEDQLRIAK